MAAATPGGTVSGDRGITRAVTRRVVGGPASGRHGWYAARRCGDGQLHWPGGGAFQRVRRPARRRTLRQAACALCGTVRGSTAVARTVSRREEHHADAW